MPKVICVNEPSKEALEDWARFMYQAAKRIATRPATQQKPTA